MQTLWLSRASATGIMIRESIGTITARYAATLTPEMIVKCTAFENSGLIRNLAMLQTSNLPFAARGTTMQRPFMLEYGKDSLRDVQAFVALVVELAQEFRGEQGYREPPSFIVTAEMATGRNSVAKLGSAYVE
jgi:hypothetical protein